MCRAIGPAITYYSSMRSVIIPHFLNRVMYKKPMHKFSLYGSSLWSLSSPLLRNIEVAFNKILRRIWHLPNRCHTGILHLVAGLDSIFNVVAKRSKYLLYAASNCPSSLTRSIFRDSSSLCYTFAGYNFLFGHRHSKHYDPQYSTCATIIRAFRSSPNTESNIEDMIRTISYD